MQTILKQQELDKLVLKMGEPGSGGVEKDENGLPKAWRILPFGTVSITKFGADGVRLSGEFTREHADRIVANYIEKASKVPIDSNHMLYMVAEQSKRDEAEIASLTGENSLAMGFGVLEKRDDGLWITDVDWTPLGADIMKQKVFRYFSPVIRGLKDGNLRITSMSVLNVPAINGLDAIAAAAETQEEPGNENPEKGDQAAVIEKIKAILGLDPDSNPEALYGALQGMLEKLKNYDSLQDRVGNLEMAAESKNRRELIDTALSDGRLTNHMLPWAEGQSVEALSAFLSVAPVQIGTKRFDGNQSPGREDIALTATEKEICSQLELSEEDMLAAKKSMNLH